MAQQKFIIDGGVDAIGDSIIQGTLAVSGDISSNGAKVASEAYVTSAATGIFNDAKAYTDTLVASSVATISSDVSNLTTDDVTEATNLYFTTDRVQSVIDANTAGFITSYVDTNDYVDGASLVGSTLTLTRTGVLSDITVDLSTLVDDTNLARIVSGSVNPTTGIATFTRDDATSFDVDFSALLDDTNLVTSVNGQTGAVTIATFSGDYNDLTNKPTIPTVPTTVSSFTNDAGYLTSETPDVLTSISINANVLSYVDEAGNTTNVDLSLYLDDSNLARIASGSVNPTTGIATFTRDDATSFDVDFSALLDDTNLVTSVNGQTGAVTVDLSGKADLTGATFTGTVTATAFVGDGSQLTGKVGFFAQSTAPTYADGARDGDLWRDSDDGSIYMATVTGTAVQWFAV